MSVSSSSPCSPINTANRRQILTGLAATIAGTGSRASPPVDLVPVPLALYEGVARGFLVPLLDLIGKAAGLKWDISYFPYARVQRQVESGQTLGFGLRSDVHTWTPLATSDPVLQAFIWLVMRQDEALEFQQIRDLQGQSMCVLLGASGSLPLAALKTANVRLEEYSGLLSTGVAMLRAGRCRLLAVSSHQGPQTERFAASLRQGHGAGLSVLPKPLGTLDVGFSVRLGHELQRFIPQLNLAIAAQRVAIRKYLTHG
jgi:ABC-type amino acid transport substrate-binding protein